MAGIAAYKSALLVRQLVKAGCEVKVIMTPKAQSFITPLTLATLSKHPVLTTLERDERSGEWENHVALGLWADLLLIAPASANTLAKLAHGFCDHLLSAVYLSARCPVIVAPAMDADMYLHATTQANLKTLAARGVKVLDATHGELASGLTGKGRMVEPENILAEVRAIFSQKQRFKGQKVLITAGPTYEKIDPVRFVGNHSSGKMGLALAHELAEEGAGVDLVAGPGQYTLKTDAIRLTSVISAQDMYEAVSQKYHAMDIAIFAAAVADYRPKKPEDQKIKKQAKTTTLQLVKNHDIAAEMGKRKQSHQMNIGFALETENEEAGAKAKMTAKNFDLMVLNSLKDPGAGFSSDTNKVTIFGLHTPKRFELKSKQKVAKDIVDCIYAKLHS